MRIAVAGMMPAGRRQVAGMMREIYAFTALRTGQGFSH